MAYNSSFTDGSRLLQIFVLPMLCIVGIYGNVMALLLMHASSVLRRLPSNEFLKALAICSTIFLAQLVVIWVENGLNIPVLSLNPFVCKYVTYTGGVCDFAAVWLITCVCFERVIVVRDSGGRLNQCYRAKWRATVVACLVVALSVALNVPLWFMVDLQRASPMAKEQCDVAPAYVQSYQSFIVLEAVFSCMLPSVLVLLCNAYVVRRMLVTGYGKTNKNRLLVLPSGPGLDPSDILLGPTSLSAESAPELCERNGDPTHSQTNEVVIAKPACQEFNRLTWCIISATSAFILLNLPNYVYRLIVSFSLVKTDGNLAASWSELICYMLYYAHHAFVFYFYVFQSPTMRRQLLPTCVVVLTCRCCGYKADRN